MKVFIIYIIVVVLSAVHAKLAETEAEKYECVANYLRDKKLLDKNFKYFVQSEELECDPIVTEMKEEILRKSLDTTPNSSSSEESEDKKEASQILNDNKACIHEKMISINYPEVIIKLFVYEKSIKTSKKQKKKLVAATQTEAENKLKIAISMCAAEPVFGEMFDDLMKRTVDEEDTLEEKQNDYCIRKHVVDKQLIDTNVFSLNLNPANIEINFDCTGKIDDVLESLEEIIRDTFEVSNQSKKQLLCLNKSLRTGKAGEYIAKTAILSEVQMTDEQKKEFRTEFVEKIKGFFQEMAKCI